MNYMFIPNNLNPGARQCTITVLCDAPIMSICWRLNFSNYKRTVIETNKFSIRKNGLYFIELVSLKERVETNISIFHLQEAKGFAGGDGTKENPYLISSCAQLNEIRLNLSAHYRLIADLDFSVEMKNLCWLPIGKFSQTEPKIVINVPYEEQDLSYKIEYGFTGELDGNGHMIIGLSCYHPKEKYIALFASSGKGAFIHDITLNNCIFQDENGRLVGTIVARSENTIIEHCFVDNSIVSASTIGGGIVGGAAPDTIIRMCSFSGELKYIRNVSGKLGGIVGSTLETEGLPIICNCCVKANINGGSYVAGIATGHALVSQCFFSGKICGTLYVAGILSTGSLANVENCVCCDVTLVYSSEEASSYKDSFWVTFADQKGESANSIFMKNAWRHHIGRIVCDDHTLGLVTTMQKNFCSKSCKKISIIEENIEIVEGSLRDGITVSGRWLHDKKFYENIGWDFVSIWEIGADNLPDIRK